MPLARRLNTDTPPKLTQEDYILMHGGLSVGRIYKRASAFRPDATWLWTITGVPGGPEGLRSSGTSATLEDAEAALNACWRQWLDWAALMEGGRAQG
jgi:hypothetical protein